MTRSRGLLFLLLEILPLRLFLPRAFFALRLRGEASEQKRAQTQTDQLPPHARDSAQKEKKDGQTDFQKEVFFFSEIQMKTTEAQRASGDNLEPAREKTKGSLDPRKLTRQKEKKKERMKQTDTQTGREEETKR